MALSYEPEGTPATEKTDAVGGWRGYLVRKIACPIFISPVKLTQTTDYGAVFVTNERLVGFASLLGDFSSKALGIHEHITRLDNEQGLVIVTTSHRTLVFDRRLSGWEEFE
jgi:hypothetical protein